MHVRFQRNKLLQPLSYVIGVVERRQTLPILSHVLLRTSDESTTLTGSDLEVEVIAQAYGEVLESGNATLPARKLYDICRALPEDTELDIRLGGEKVLLKAGRSRFSLLTLPDSDFPDIPTSEWEHTLSITEDTLKRLIEQTYFCMAQQDIRYYLNGLLLELQSDRLRVVATDGHRMALSEAPIEGAGDIEKQLIVPRKGVQELSRLLGGNGALTLRTGPNHLRVEMSGVTLTTKLIDGRYPDYNKVIPAVGGEPVYIERQRFREALSRAAILSTEKFRGVRINLDRETMTITVHNPDQEEACEELSVKYKGKPIEIGFNVSYLIDAVSALQGEELQFTLTDPNSSSLLQEKDSAYPKYVIMPMRL